MYLLPRKSLPLQIVRHGPVGNGQFERRNNHVVCCGGSLAQVGFERFDLGGAKLAGTTQWQGEVVTIDGYNIGPICMGNGCSFYNREQSARCKCTDTSFNEHSREEMGIHK